MNDTRNAPESMFAPPAVIVNKRADGAIFLESPMPLAAGMRCLGDYLEYWASVAPDRDFLLEKSEGGAWTGVTYAQARDQVYRIATWLLGRGAGPDRPVVVLSDNSVEHGLLMLACMHVGIPYSGVSPAYSLVSKDYSKLKGVIERLRPSVVYAADPQLFGAALTAIAGLHDAVLVAGAGKSLPPAVVAFPALLASCDEGLVKRAFDAVSADTVAKILFTSGSTSEPKGVINTQRMLCASQQAKAQLWPFLAATPPVLLDWLPWNHTFGGNHNFNLILAQGGTLYIDAGKPAPGLFDTSIANLRDVSPTLYLNVPRGYDMLVPILRADAALRASFFSRLQLIFYAAAALPQHLWEALQELSIQELGYVVPMVSGWGSTETSPMATDCHFKADKSGVIGLPVPGVTLKLVPSGGKLEVRVKGPNVMPGYFKQPALSASAFDDDGFYMIGDAVRFVNPEAPEQGLLFDGRVTEDFKLLSGTWVNVGALRLACIERMAPMAQDVVVTGHDRNEICVLVIPNLAACRKLAGLPGEASPAAVLASQSVREHFRKALEAGKRANTGSSTFAVRALLMEQAPLVDAGEITDKGYINQGAVLRNRAALVERLYARGSDPDLISV